MIPSKDEFFRALAEKHGLELQKRFSAASVAVCGLGGLGSNIAAMLARAGVGRLHLVDFDRVSVTNLNRQFYFPEQIGMFKACALKENIQHIAPYCDVKSEVIEINGENVCGLIAGEELVCEAFDKAEAKAMLVNAVLENFPDKYLVSGSGMAGLGTANNMKTKKISDRFYICGDLASDADEVSGMFGTRVLVCAAHQAHAVLRMIAGENDC